MIEPTYTKSLRKLVVAALVGIGIVGTVAAQTPSVSTVYVAPVPGSWVEDRPKTYEYVRLFVGPGRAGREECRGRVLPVGTPTATSYVAWFEYQPGKGHSVLLWDSNGHLLYDNSAVSSSGNIVKDVCEAIQELKQTP